MTCPDTCRPPALRPFRPPRWTPWALAAILLLAAGLRLYGLAWDEGARLHCDENSTLGMALRLGAQVSQEGLPRPDRSDYGALSLYLLLLLLAPVTALSGLLGASVEPGALALWTGRGLSVAADTGAVLLIYLIGRRVWGPVAGLLGAALYATALLAVREAHFFTVDPLGQLALLLFLWLCLRAAQKPSVGAFVWVGVALGLQMSLKMSALAWLPLPVIIWLVTCAQRPREDPSALRRAWVALALLALLALTPAVGWRLGEARIAATAQTALAERMPQLAEIRAPVFWERQMQGVLNFLGGALDKLAVVGLLLAAAGLLWSRYPAGAGALATAWRRQGRLWGSLLAAVGVFVLLNPLSLLEPRSYWLPTHATSVTSNLLNGAGAFREAPFAWTFQFVGTTPGLYQLRHIYPYALGWPLLALAAVAVVYWSMQTLRGRAGLGWLLVAAIWLSLLSVGGTWMKMSRYLLPQVPLLCLLAGGMLGVMLASPRRVARLTGMGLASVTLTGSLLWCLAYLSMYTERDSRLQALAWLQQHAPPSSRVLLEEDDTWGASGMALWERQEQWPVQIYDPHYLEHDYYGVALPPEPRAAKQRYLDRHLAQADYLVLTGLRRERLAPVAAHFPVLDGFYRRLWTGQAGFTLVWQARPQPRLLGLTLSTRNAEPSFRLFDHPDVYVFARSTAGGTEHEDWSDLRHAR